MSTIKTWQQRMTADYSGNTPEAMDDEITELRAALVKAEAERDALRADALRYRWMRAETKVHLGSCFDQSWFLLPNVKPMQGQNIMQGSVAQHLDKAIDAAMEGQP